MFWLWPTFSRGGAQTVAAHCAILHQAFEVQSGDACRSADDVSDFRPRRPLSQRLQDGRAQALSSGLGFGISAHHATSCGCGCGCGCSGNGEGIDNPYSKATASTAWRRRDGTRRHCATAAVLIPQAAATFVTAPRRLNSSMRNGSLMPHA